MLGSIFITNGHTYVFNASINVHQGVKVGEDMIEGKIHGRNIPQLLKNKRPSILIGTRLTTYRRYLCSKCGLINRCVRK